MIYTLALKNLPFQPLKSQIIYVESSYNENVNKYIEENLEHLCIYCSLRGYQFCYLPKMSEQGLDDRVLYYYAPYAKPNDKPEVIGSDYLLQFMSHPENKELIPPSLIYLSENIKEKPGKGEVLFKAVSVTDQDEYPTIEDIFDLRLREIIKELFVEEREPIVFEERRGEVMFSIAEDDEIERRRSERRKRDIRGDLMEWHDLGEKDEEYPLIAADDKFDEESKMIAEDVKKKILYLKQRGIDTLFLKQYIFENEPLSHLHITKDFRIFLPDYDNKEIEMTPLPKAVFLLFLKHPKGIIFKCLPDYREELKDIYFRLKPSAWSAASILSVEDVTDPFNNSINEKCARIREAFVRHFDEHLAKNYFITGERGKPKKITLPRTLVKFDDEIASLFQ